MPDNSGVMIILCGLPSSGKSWFAKQLGDHISRKNQYMNIRILDIDNVRMELFGTDFKPENEEFVRETALEHARDYLRKNTILIVDDINYYNSMRHGFKQIADEQSCPYLILYISTPLEVCLKWNESRKNCLEEHVITKIAENFDIPGQKYSWDTPFEIINVAEDDISQKIKHISDKINKIKTRSSSTLSPKTQQTSSVKQEIENLTREFIQFYANMFFHPQNIKNAPQLFLNVSKLPQFSKIKTKFGTEIVSLNVTRRKFMENTPFDEFTLNDSNHEKIHKQIFTDFLDYLLK